MDIETIYSVYCGVIFFISGCCLGSFLNCAAYRIAHGEDFLRGRSHCTTCGHELSLPDLIPVISYLLSRGKCRYCGEKISIRYPLTEVIFGILMVGCFLHSGLSILTARDVIFVCCLFCLSLVDLEIREIPDGCHIISAAAWFLTCYFIYGDVKTIVLHIAAGLTFGGVFLGMSLIMDKVLGRESLGGGDIKLFAVAGLYLGFLPSLFCVIIACVIGLLAAVIIKERSISFGPFIAVGTYFMLLWGEILADRYLALLGL